jgi:hypothetical protein
MELALSFYEAPPSPTFDLAISLDPESAAEVSECLRACEQLPAVKDDQSLAICIEQGKEVKALINGIEESRESLKKPFLKACRLIDDSAKRARAKLEEAYQNVMSAVAIFEGVRRREREAEKAKHEAELARLARQAHNEADEAKRAELIRQAQDAALAANKVVQPVQGMALTKSYKFEIEDLDEIWKFKRSLLKIELSHAACMDVVRVMRDAGAREIQIPGVKVTEIVGARVAGARS